MNEEFLEVLLEYIDARLDQYLSTPGAILETIRVEACRAELFELLNAGGGYDRT